MSIAKIFEDNTIPNPAQQQTVSLQDQLHIASLLLEELITETRIYAETICQLSRYLARQDNDWQRITKNCLAQASQTDIYNLQIAENQIHQLRQEAQAKCTQK